MNKLRNKINLDKTLEYTQSSFAYKDPYRPHMNVAFKAKNKVWSFFAMRNIENEFIDFRSYEVADQFKEIYGDVYQAFKRSDKVVL